MLEGNVEIGSDEPLGHQRDDGVDMGVGVDIMEADPRPLTVRRPEGAKLPREIGHMGAHLAALPLARLVPGVDAISRRVLADDEQFARAGGDQFLRLAQHCVDPAAGELSAQRRDDAEGATVVAAFGNLEVAVMARGELDVALRRLRDEIEIRALRGRGGGVDRAHHILILVRAGDRQHVRKAGADRFRLIAHAAGDDHPAIFGDGLPNRFEAFLLGAVEKAAGVDEDNVRAGIVAAHRITIRTQARQDALAVDQSLGAAKRNHADTARLGENGAHGSGRP